MHIRKPEPHELPSPRQLLLASVAAMVVMAVLLITVILPAERGVDPSGIGDRLNLTRMGLLKSAMSEPEAPHDNRPQRADELSITIPPGEGQEIKMKMKKGFEVSYSWHASAPIFHDTHSDITGNEDVFITHSRAESTLNHTGTIIAPFGGGHGWYWKNRSDEPITVTVNADGEYLDIAVK